MAFIVRTLNKQGDIVNTYYCLSAKSTIECIWNVSQVYGVMSVHINKATECFDGYLVNGNWIYGFDVANLTPYYGDRDKFNDYFQKIIKD